MADQEILKVLGGLIKEINKMAESEDSFLQIASECLLIDTVGHLTSAVKELQNIRPKSVLTSERLAEMAALASEYDKTGDPLLMKQAELLDEILLTIGSTKNAVVAAKQAQDIEVAKIKERNKKNDDRDPYTFVKAELDKQNKVDEARKAITDKVKEYRILESPLNTRTCPDHPGAQMARIAEHTYQCSLDKNIYNYNSGYTTMKGNVIPGGDVSNQTQDFDRPNESTSFDTRESRLNQ